MSIWDPIEDAWNELEDAASDGYELFENIFNEAASAGEYFISSIIAIVEAGVELTAGAIGELVEKFAEAVESFADSVAGAVESFLKEMGPLGELVIDIANWSGKALGAAVEAIAEGTSDIAEWAIDELIPFAFSVLKAGAALVAAIYMLPAFIVGVLICTQVTRMFGEEYGTVLKAVTKGYARYTQLYRIHRIPDSGKYVIFSDLHRYPNGDLDIPRQQNVLKLYCGVLSYYYQLGYTVIENGDVEDYWLRRGASWEPAYALGGNFIGVAGQAATETALHGVGGYHLGQVMQNPNNAPVYSILRQFHKEGRYLRTMGNHDDVYRSPAMVRELKRYFSDIQVYDYIVIDGKNGGVAVIAHGHQTDGWNNSACAFLGRVTTGIAASLNEVLPDGMELGVPKPAASYFWDGTAPNELTEVSPIVGATIDTDSLDEIQLHETYASTFDRGIPPHIILGHTHAPRHNAWDPDHHNYFASYVNDGCVLLKKTLTAVEWDGSVPDRKPTLAGWQYSTVTTQVRRRTLLGEFNKLKSLESDKGDKVTLECPVPDGWPGW